MRILALLPLLAITATISWEAPLNEGLVEHYIVEYKYGDLEWTRADSLSSCCLVVQGLTDGVRDMIARVAWISKSGAQGPWSVPSFAVSDNRVPGEIGQPEIELVPE